MMTIRLALAGSLLVAAALDAASRPPVRARNGMVSSASAPASEAGVEILRRGGNAIDAAVATAFALAVTYPSAGNLGGGGFMIVRLADGAAHAIDYRETASRHASKTMFLDAQGAVIPGASKTGHRAVGVPGTVAGMALAHEKFGKLAWKDLLAPATRLARDGFPVTHAMAASLRSQEKKFRDYPDSVRVFLRGGRLYEEGEMLVQPDLAATLERMAREGPREFYEGKTARLLADEMRLSGGLVDLEDLRAYRAVPRRPVHGSYRGYDIVSMSPVSSGGFLLAQMLAMLERHDLGAMGPYSSGRYHLLIETMKRAFADRAAHFGDPAFVRVPLAGLLSPAYIGERAGSIDPNRATPSAEIREGAPPATESSETTHFSVVDAAGNAVSNTYTLRDGYGSGITVRGAGFLLNNVMDEFAAKAGAPNAFGFPAGEANTIAPGKRPVSSQTPTIGSKNGKLAFVAGSPGGTTIPNTVLQVVLNLVDHGMNIQEAVDAPRIHHQWLPDVVRYEPHGMASDVALALGARGHILAPPGQARAIGMVHGIAIEPLTGVRLGASDARSPDGGVSGY
ncbi:MAG: gamma-glutamyltransferase [Bryobacteraceae bacterium]